MNSLDAEQFDALHRDYRDRLVQSLTGLVRDRDRAEDIAATAFATAWEKREKFQGESKPSTWLEAMARNEARQSWSRERIDQFDSLDGSDARQFAAPELVTDELEKEDERSRLHKALERLPRRHRRVLVAHFVEGLSIRQIADRDRLPVGTVLSRIFTAKQLLRHAWDQSGTALPADVGTPATPPPNPGGKEDSPTLANAVPKVQPPEPSPWDR